MILQYADSDLYSSAKLVLTTLTEAGAIGAGTIIVFDELLHYPGWKDNEILALFEWKSTYFAEWEWICVKVSHVACFGVMN